MRNATRQPAGGTRSVFIAVLVVEIIFLMAARTPLDTDLWWHLAAGEQTLQNGAPVLADTFSFTRAGSPWINHSWLGEVALALANRAGGWLGLGALVAVLAAAAMALAYGQMEGPPIWRAFIVVLAGLVAAPVWTARPQLFSLLLLALVNEVLERHRSGGRVGLPWLPVIFAVWSNLHGGYPLGLVLLACAVGGALLDRLMGREDAPPLRQTGQLALWSLACLPAVLINPNGLNMWRIPFQTVGVGALQQAIPEWASPDFHEAVQQPFLLMLAGLLAAFALAGRPASGQNVLTVLAFTGLALAARRNFGPFAVVTAPVLASAGWEAIRRLGRPPGVLARISSAAGAARPLNVNVQRVMNLGIVAFLGLAGLVKLYAATQPALVEGYIRQNFPVGAVEWIRANRPPGNLLNEYAWGGYLDWSLRDYPVFLDGRTDLFGDEVIGEWLIATGAEEGWQEVLERRQVRLTLLPPGLPLERELGRAGWKLLYRDDVAVIYGR